MQPSKLTLLDPPDSAFFFWLRARGICLEKLAPLSRPLYLAAYEKTLSPSVPPPRLVTIKAA
jgi:hypothetical protein